MVMPCGTNGWKWEHLRFQSPNGSLHPYAKKTTPDPFTEALAIIQGF